MRSISPKVLSASSASAAPGALVGLDHVEGQSFITFTKIPEPDQEFAWLLRPSNGASRP